MTDGLHAWIVAREGGEPFPFLTELPPSQFVQLFQSIAWSPDGRHIALPRGLDEIWITEADGSHEIRFTLPVSLKGGTRVSWSPDGEYVAYNCSDHLCTIRRDGTDLHRLAPDLKLGPFESPVWLPRGDVIVVVAGDLDIYVVRVDGSGQTNITPQGLPIAGNPAVSPDGSRIAFDSYLDLYVVNVDGSGLTEVAGMGLTNQDASWSADGKSIAYSCDDLGASINNVCLVTADGAGWRRLSATGAHPVWSPVP